jgi:hypothetical protein
MNKIHFNIIFLFLTLVLFSCKKDKLNGEKEILIGKWKWVYSDATLSFCNPPTSDIIITPITKGMNYSIEFDKKGKVIFYENNNLTEDYRIVFTQWKVSDYVKPFEYMFSINLNNDEDVILYGAVKQDTLLIFPATFPFDDSDGCNYHWSYFVKE